MVFYQSRFFPIILNYKFSDGISSEKHKYLHDGKV
jgi:hypothetical protein